MKPEEVIKIIRAADLKDGDLVFIDPSAGINDEALDEVYPSLPNVTIFFCFDPHKNILHVPMNRGPK